MGISASHLTSADLAAAAHTHELTPRKEITLCIDHRQRGLGGASCGPDVLRQYVVSAQPVSFSFGIMPCNAKKTDLEDAARIVFPLLSAPVIRRDDNDLVSLTTSTPGGSFASSHSTRSTANRGPPWPNSMSLR